MTLVPQGDDHTDVTHKLADESKALEAEASGTVQSEVPHTGQAQLCPHWHSRDPAAVSFFYAQAPSSVAGGAYLSDHQQPALTLTGPSGREHKASPENSG